MASIILIGNAYRAQVRRSGQPVMTKSFSLKMHGTLAAAEKEAKAWVAKLETEINSGKKIGVHGKTGVLLGKAIERYLEENPALGKTGVDILGYLKKGIGHLYIDKLSDDDIVIYIQKKNFGPMSGAMHFSFLSSVLIMAKVDWKLHVPEILDEARARLRIRGLIGSSRERDRRPTENEIKMLLDYKFPTPIPMADIIRFAMSSAMRQAEITRIKHLTVDTKHKTVVITDRKHPKKKKGNHKTVPLLDESLAIIKRQVKVEGNDNIFPFNPSTIGTYFTLACQALGIVDLRFHDLRHEGTSRLFEMGYQIHEVAMFTGHEDWKMLKRYTQLKAKDIRRFETAEEDATPSVEGVQMDAETLKQFKQFQAMMVMMKQTEKV